MGFVLFLVRGKIAWKHHMTIIKDLNWHTNKCRYALYFIDWHFLVFCFSVSNKTPSFYPFPKTSVQPPFLLYINRQSTRQARSLFQSAILFLPVILYANFHFTLWKAKLFFWLYYYSWKNCLIVMYLVMIIYFVTSNK